MSLAFSPFCNRCVAPLQPQKGRVCSCSCFLCDDCSSLLLDKASNPEGACPGCGKAGVNTIDLSSSGVPLEVGKSLSDATPKLESLHEILQFQIKHYRKALDSARKTIIDLELKNASLEHEKTSVVKNQKKFFDPEEESSFYESGLSRKRPRTAGSSDLSTAQISPPSSSFSSSSSSSGGGGGDVPTEWQVSPPNRPYTSSSTAQATDGRGRGRGSGQGGGGRPSTSPDHPSRRLSPQSRQSEGPKWSSSPGTGITPSALYSTRIQSPPNKPNKSGPHAHGKMWGHGPMSGQRSRSPYLSIKSPQLRPSTGGSVNSSRSVTGAISSMTGHRSTTATKEDLLQQRREAWAEREHAKTRQEISRFQGQGLD